MERDRRHRGTLVGMGPGGRFESDEKRWNRLREHAVAVSSIEPWVALLSVVAALAGAWVVSYASGGSQTAGLQLFYVPIVVVAIRFGARAALAVSVLAGLLCGPLLPLDVDDGTGQSWTNWGARLGVFIVVGQVVAFFCRHSLPSLRAEIRARRWCQELNHAIQAGQVHVHYQPIVDLHTGRLAGVEALVRWDHPTRGRIPTEEFVTMAEETGCVGLITDHVLHVACAQTSRWRQAGLDLGPTFVATANISALDLCDEGLADKVRSALDRSGLPPEALHLEVTETALVTDLTQAIRALEEVKALGVRVAIDDFGTGESSLGHLAELPADLLKIDRQLVHHIHTHERGPELIGGIVALADALGLETIAEGIETPEQARAVAATGCRYGQGYLFARPLPPDDLAALLREPGPVTETVLAHRP